jgi:hypothetical protein
MDHRTLWQRRVEKKEIEALGLSSEQTKALKDSGIFLVSDLTRFNKIDSILHCDISLQDMMEIPAKLERYLETNGLSNVQQRTDNPCSYEAADHAPAQQPTNGPTWGRSGVCFDACWSLDYRICLELFR